MSSGGRAGQYATGWSQKPLGGTGVRGGQSEGNLSLPLKVPLSAPLPLW